MYTALKPQYIAIGDFYAVRWTVLGVAFDMADAKKRYGGSPVLEKL